MVCGQVDASRYAYNAPDAKHPRQCPSSVGESHNTEQRPAKSSNDRDAATVESRTKFGLACAKDCSEYGAKYADECGSKLAGLGVEREEHHCIDQDRRKKGDTSQGKRNYEHDDDLQSSNPRDPP